MVRVLRHHVVLVPAGGLPAATGGLQTPKRVGAVSLAQSTRPVVFAGERSDERERAPPDAQPGTAGDCTAASAAPAFALAAAPQRP